MTATLACAVHGAARIAGERMFEIGEGDLAYVRVAQFVVDRLPPNAMLLSMQHSGTLRYYAGRPTLRYDWVAREWWPRALDVLVAQGFQPFFVVSEFEEPFVRARLPASKPGEDVMGCLVAKEVRAEGVRIYNPLARALRTARIEPEVRNPCRRPATMTPRRAGARRCPSNDSDDVGPLSDRARDAVPLRLRRSRRRSTSPTCSRAICRDSACRHTLRVDPAPSALVHRVDYFGNGAAHFTLLTPHDSLVVSSHSLVQVDERTDDIVAEASPAWEDVREALAFRRGAGRPRRRSSAGPRPTWPWRPSSPRSPASPSARAGRCSRPRSI